MYINIVKKNKIISLFSIILIVITLVLSSIYFSIEIGHNRDDHNSNDCPICLVLSICKNNIDNIKCSIGSSFNITMFFISVLFCVKVFNCYIQNKTLVSMKIRLND